MKMNEKLIKILKENPNLPIYQEFKNTPGIYGGYLTKKVKSVSVIEILEYEDIIFTNKKKFREDYYNYYSDKDVWDGMTDEEIEKKLDEVCYSQNWNKVILIY